MTPRTDWKEEIAPDEATRFEDYAQKLAALRRTDAKGGKLRVLHAKGIVGARAQLTVLPGLPDHARVGIFAAPGSYDAWVRYLNGGPAPSRDQQGDIRGLAFKVLGVRGKKLIPGMEDALTQDFLLINAPVQEFRNVDEFVFFVLAAQRPLTLLPKVFARFGFGRTLKILKGFKALSQKLPSLAGQRFWSAVPIRWGDCAAKYSLLPVVPNGPASSVPPSPNYLGDDLIEKLAKGPVEYDFAAQYYVDVAKTPIENPSVEWREEDAPFVRLARLTIKQQDLRSEQGQRDQTTVEAMSFDPWHAPVEFRPLGDFQRARNHAYRVSTIGRAASKEPTGLSAA